MGRAVTFPMGRGHPSPVPTRHFISGALILTNSMFVSNNELLYNLWADFLISKLAQKL